jgi:hypothetical protein
MFAMVIIEDRVDEGLAGYAGNCYMGPPQRISDARELVRIVLGAPPAGPGPWRRAIAGGQRMVALHPVSQSHPGAPGADVSQRVD